MFLSLGVLLALAQSCAPRVAPDTLLSVASAESGFDPLAVAVNVTPRQVFHPADAAAATALAGRLIADGRSVDLGLGQINNRNLPALRLSLADVFDPCRNLAASAEVLAAGYRRAAPTPGAEQAGLATALSYYNTGDPGSITTVHADSAALAFEQLTLLVKESEAGQGLSRDDIQALLRQLVDIVVHLERRGGRFRITEVWHEPLRKRAMAT